MATRSKYAIIEDDLLSEEPLVIKDAGDHSRRLTVTNGAEHVVMELWQTGHLNKGRRLFYIDSEGNKDEICHAEGKFTGFRVGPR